MTCAFYRMIARSCNLMIKLHFLRNSIRFNQPILPNYVSLFLSSLTRSLAVCNNRIDFFPHIFYLKNLIGFLPILSWRVKLPGPLQMEIDFCFCCLFYLLVVIWNKNNISVAKRMCNLSLTVQALMTYVLDYEYCI